MEWMAYEVLPDVPGWVSIPAVVALGLGVLLLGFTRWLRRGLDKCVSSTYELFEPGEDEDLAWIRVCERKHAWAQVERLEFVGWVRNVPPGGVPDPHVPPQCGAFWFSPMSKVWLSQSITAKTLMVEFTTEFETDVSLDTATSGEIHVVPKPAGVYKQSFPKADIAELWRTHTDMVSYLLRHGARGPIGDSETIVQKLNAEARRLKDILRSHRCYGLRSVLWLAIRPRQWRNLSIADQHDRGMITMPGEPAME